jgi:hypothetical protein
MDNTSTTTGTLDQTDEDILTSTVSDEALEAAAGTERGAPRLDPHLHGLFPWLTVSLA